MKPAATTTTDPIMLGGTIAQTRRALLAGRSHRCDPKCPGWIIANDDEIQACDECTHDLPFCDDDAAQLPEALLALAHALGWRRARDWKRAFAWWQERSALAARLANTAQLLDDEDIPCSSDTIDDLRRVSERLDVEARAVNLFALVHRPKVKP